MFISFSHGLSVRTPQSITVVYIKPIKLLRTLLIQCNMLHAYPQTQNTFRILHDLITAQLRVPIDSVDKTDGNLADAVTRRPSTHHHLHLERVALTLCLGNDTVQHMLLVQSERPGEVTDARTQHDGRKQVRAAGNELSLQIPAVDTTVAGIPGSRDDVVVVRLLQGDEVGNELGLLGYISI
jgi:hypothetical protein